MDGKQTVWAVIGGASLLVGYRALNEGYDPIPQLAGIGASGVILLFMADPFPKLASSFAILMGLTLALNWDNIGRLVPTGPDKPDVIESETVTPNAGPR